MRRGTLFEENKEQVSVFFENLFTHQREYAIEDADALFHPVTSALTYNFGVLQQNQSEADFRVILAEAADGIDDSGAYTLLRHADNTEYTVVDVLSFAGEMHLFVQVEEI